LHGKKGSNSFRGRGKQGCKKKKKKWWGPQKKQGRTTAGKTLAVRMIGLKLSDGPARKGGPVLKGKGGEINFFGRKIIGGKGGVEETGAARNRWGTA